MATVYQALDLRLQRKVALKVMSPELLRDPGMIERFRREAQIIASLHHQHIVPVHSVEEFGELHFFELRFVEGPTLRSVLEKAAPLPVEVVRAWFAQIAEALDYAHERGVVHRDVKPGNILIELDGTAVLTDFGIAKIEQAPRQTATGLLVGTTTYMSPEQWSGSGIGPASDQYSLGIVLYEMLTGDVPFSGNMRQLLTAHLAEAPTALTKLRNDCPRDLARAVTRMLEKAPESRWPNLTEAARGGQAAKPNSSDPIYEELRALAQGEGPEGVPRLSGTRSTTTASGFRSTTTRITKVVRARPKTTAGVAALAVALPFSLLSMLGTGSGGVDPTTPAGPSGSGAAGPFADSGFVEAPTPPPPTTQLISDDPAATSAVLPEGSEGQATGSGVAVAVGGEEPSETDGVPASISAVPDSILLEVGLREILDPVALNRAGRPVDAQLSLRSLDPGVAEVGEDARGSGVLGVRPGRTSVRIAAGGIGREIPVVVVEEPVAGVHLAQSRVDLQPGESVRASARVEGLRGSTLTREVAWSSSRPEVAGITASGIVEAVGPGEAFIVATVGTHADTAVVSVASVTLPEVTSLAVTQPELFETGDGAKAVRTEVTLSTSGGNGLPWCVGVTVRAQDGQTFRQTQSLPPGDQGGVQQLEFSTLLESLGLSRGDSYRTDSCTSSDQLGQIPSRANGHIP